MSTYKSPLRIRSEADGTDNRVHVKIYDGVTSPAVNAAKVDDDNLLWTLGHGLDADGDHHALLTDDNGVLFVSIEEPTLGTDLFDFDKAVDVVKDGGTSVHSYTPAAGKKLVIKQIVLNATGYADALIAWGVTASEVDKVHIGVTPSDTTTPITFAQFPEILETDTLKITKANTDNQAQDLNTTIIGELRDV